QQYCERLYQLVDLVHNTTTQAYAFAKYIFINDAARDPNFNIQENIMEKFFSEVWHSMVNKAEHRTQGETARIRELINRHKDEYLRKSGYDRPAFPYSQQCSSYEGTKIYTA
ncbi:hypothetical protein BX666DRAFT_1868969, partial [Dichotomocladium elegans]